MSVDIGAYTSLSDRKHLDAFSDALRQSLVQARLCGNTVIACCSLPLTATTCDLRALFAVADVYEARWYWSDPDTHKRWCALGSAAIQEYDSLRPVSEAAQALADLTSRVIGFGDAVPHWLAGFAFDPEHPRDELWRDWSNGLLMLPRFVIEQRPEHETMVTVCVEVQPHTDTESQRDRLMDELIRALDRSRTGTMRTGATRRDRWMRDDASDDRRLLAAAEEDRNREQAGAASLSLPSTQAVWTDATLSVEGDIRQGLYEKVVLARRERVSVQAFARLPQTLQDLETRYGDGVVFAVARGSQVFAGATPERLVQTGNGAVSIDCLAGTAPRGVTPDEDATMADMLFASHKNREEHSFVLRGILGDIAGSVEAVQFPEEPTVRKLANVQHLYTPVRGQLSSGMSILDVVARLHPTPAVAGSPKQTALQIIRERERMDRGWYAGPLGWIDGEGNGMFVVTLRSALMDENGADLFAGAGIVAGSEPLAEWQETEWKMRPMRVALGQELMK